MRVAKVRKKKVACSIIVTDRQNNEYLCAIDQVLFQEMSGNAHITVYTRENEEKRFIKSFLTFKEIIE